MVHYYLDIGLEDSATYAPLTGAPVSLLHYRSQIPNFNLGPYTTPNLAPNP